MTDYITDREIERLALGELDETDANELMKRLEERGELERLEAIIADDEAFLEAHPPALLASQIRAEVRRRSREHNTKEPRMIQPSRTRFAAGIVAGFAVAAILFTIVYIQANPSAPERFATNTNNATTNKAAPAPEPTPVPKPEPEPEDEQKRQVLLDRGKEFLLPSTFYMSVGEIIEAPALGIHRFSISVTKVIGATIHEEGNKLYIEAKEVGQSMMSLTQTRNGQPHTRSALVVVGEPLADDVIRRLVEGDYSEGDASLLECDELSDEVVTMRIVAQYGSTFVGHAHAEGKELSPELRRCIDNVVGRWRVGMLVEPAEIRDDKSYTPGPAQLSVGKVRFNFGRGAQCLPDSDDC